MAALFTAVRKAGAALSAQLALTFFVPLCLTGLAIVARVQAGCLSLFQIYCCSETHCGELRPSLFKF